MTYGSGYITHAVLSTVCALLELISADATGLCTFPMHAILQKEQLVSENRTPGYIFFPLQFWNLIKQPNLLFECPPQYCIQPQSQHLFTFQCLQCEVFVIIFSTIIIMFQQCP